MLKEKALFITFLFMALTLGGVISCSDNARTKPKYIFKEAPDDSLAAQMGDVKITQDELVSGIESDIYEAEMKIYETKMGRLRSLILEKLMNNDPRKEDISNDEFLEKYILEEKLKISEKEIKEFAKERKIPSDNLNKMMKERVKKFLEFEKKKEAIDKWIAKKTENDPIEVFFQKPKRPVYEIDTQGQPFWGDSNAPVVIAEFSDFQCPYCANVQDTIDALKKKYGKDKLKLVFMNYPLPSHTNAKQAAVAGLCANDQSSEHFWKLHDLMFANQDGLGESGLRDLAKNAGLDMDKFNSCLASKEKRQVVQKTVRHGQELSVSSTPTFFVNGKLVKGAQDVGVFSEVIDEELSKF